jgi:hypothetical protein
MLCLGDVEFFMNYDIEEVEPQHLSVSAQVVDGLT